MSENQNPSRKYRSFFWPIMLVGAGVIWLLTNLKIVPTENLWILFRLWPVLIIMAGLDILFARRLAIIGALLGLMVMAGVVYILLNGGGFGLEGAPEVKTEQFLVEVGNTKSVNFDLDLSFYDTSVSVDTTSANLLTADISHIGEVNFTVAGAENKQISLQQTSFPEWTSWMLPEIAEEEEPVWKIGLSPEIPFDLDVDASTGLLDMDLSQLQLERLQFDGSTGTSTIILPDSSTSYDVFIESSTGDLAIWLPSETNLTMHLDGSTGKITLNTPENVNLQIKVLDGGPGDLTLREGIMRISGQEGRDEGIYQTADFEAAAFQTVIIIENISTGNIIVK